MMTDPKWMEVLDITVKVDLASAAFVGFVVGVLLTLLLIWIF